VTTSPSDDPSAAPDAGRRADRHTGALGRNLPLAIASGVALAAVFLATLWLSAWLFLTFVAVLIVIGLLELDVVLRGKGLHPATPVAAAVGLIAFYGTYARGAIAQSLALVLLVVGTVAWVLLLPPPEPRRIGERPKGRVTADVGATCLIALWVPFLASFLSLLLVRPDGRWYVLATIGLAVVNDIGAFAAGSRFGTHKLAPKVSPSKTWEGFAGGIALTAVVAVGIVGQFPGFDWLVALVFGLAVAVAGTLGDLAESLVKRDLGVKDLGRVLPGHGGIMDRVDAIIFALPVAHLTLVLFGL
jgi:phosphatidate cytidylyltransferase